MKPVLFALFVALLMVGCGEQAQKEVVEGEVKEKVAQTEAKDDPTVPMAIPCEVCDKKVSKRSTTCPNCGHPTPDSVVEFKRNQKRAEEERRLAEIRAEERRKRQEEERIRAEEEWKRNEPERKSFMEAHRPQVERARGVSGQERRRREEERRIKSYSGPEVLAKIKKTKESSATVLVLEGNKITDVSPLMGLTDLRKLNLENNEISDLSPLMGLKNLEALKLMGNQITEDQKAMLKKALPRRYIRF